MNVSKMEWTAGERYCNALVNLTQSEVNMVFISFAMLWPDDRSFFRCYTNAKSPPLRSQHALEH